ncbi:uncharacterized protein LOC132744360 isoform X2 [Ruditapes philippinarum]|uniref:uncharacterized protein LOC132744360 isoform X2 n=1 Tax=Ruditapes philippinarum TaxID=129788 RepID=UPI00295BB70E|nr:uncharacterized protein LOC132744360 isoform X2 [Ruditapes philippinarum]
MRRSTRKRNPPARFEDHDEPPPRKRQPQRKSQAPAAHKVPIPPNGSTRQQSSATVSAYSHTSTSRAPTLLARANTSSPVTAMPQQADMAQQCLKQDIKLENRQDKMSRSTRKRKPLVRPVNHDKMTLRKRQPQATPPHRTQIIQREAKLQSRSPSVATSSSRPPTPPTGAPTPPHVISIPPQVDMTQQLLEQNNPLVNEQELEMTQSSDIVICRKAIIKNFVALKKYLHPDPIIDCDTGFELLNVADRRNIQGKDPTDKNETILKKVISKGAKGYTDFEERLKKTWQTELLELIVCAENGQDTTEIESRLRKTALLCPEYIKQRGGKSIILRLSEHCVQW